MQRQAGAKVLRWARSTHAAAALAFEMQILWATQTQCMWLSLKSSMYMCGPHKCGLEAQGAMGYQGVMWQKHVDSEVRRLCSSQ